MQVASSKPAAWLLLAALAACGQATAEGGWRDDPDAPSNRSAQAPSPSVGMWGNDDGWSIIDEVRLGAAASAASKQGGDAVQEGCVIAGGRRSPPELGGGGSAG